jgi:ABC-2 type transport system permease protein
MVIHDRSYSRWKGDRSSPVEASSVILGAGLRRGAATIFRRKIPAVALILFAFGPFVFFFLGILALAYVQGTPQYANYAENLREEPWASLIRFSPGWIYTYMYKAQLVFVVIACVLLGSGLIAEDRRANALELYFTRPVTARRYLLGKFGVIASYIAMVTVIPASILVLAQLSVSWSAPGELLRLAGLLARTLLGGSVLVLVPSLTILAASALADRARNAAILWLGVVVMLELVVSNILREVFQADGFYLLQIGFNIRQVLVSILGNSEDLTTTVPVWMSVLVLAGWVALCLRVLALRVKPVEIVA